MSLALIQESAKEVRRLAIAGSPLAVGDFRLKKLAAPLEQAGAKVPVFAQVAKAINDVVNGKEADSAANLLNLSTLLNAILYTQGQSSAEGEMRELENFVSNSASTRTPARLLKPLVQALTSTGGGRFETVKSAVERGAFNDLRLIDPAIQALGDVYPELADLVAEKILPGYGPGIVPLLKSGLDLKGKKSDARRLQIMHELDPAETLPLCKTALEDGSPEVKATAIACLGKHEDCLPLVLEQTKAKNKSLRAAALETLAAHDLPAVRKLFIELIQGTSLEEVVGPLRLVKNREVFNTLLAEAKIALAKALKNEAAGVLRYFEILQCLERRTDAPTEEYLVATMSQAVPIAKIKAANCVISGPDILRQLAELLYGLGSPQALNLIITHQDKLPVDTFPLVLLSALRTWSPAKVFDEFAPLLEQKKRPAKDYADAIERAMRSSWHREVAEDLGADPEDQVQNLAKIEWDARWLDAAIKADRVDMVGFLARPGHKGVITYLLKQLDGKGHDLFTAIHALSRCQYPKLTETFLGLVTKRIKGVKQVDYNLINLFNCARHLPAADLPKLDAFAAKLDEKFVDHFLEALAPLRTTNQPTEA
jgi:hypothetical protein